MTKSEVGSMDRYALVRKTSEGWVVFYPDPGFVECPEDCVACTKKPSMRKQRWIKSEEVHSTRAQAIKYAAWLGYRNVQFAKGG